MAAYGFAVRLNIPYEEAVRRVTAALKDEGFGILTVLCWPTWTWGCCFPAT